MYYKIADLESKNYEAIRKAEDFVMIVCEKQQ